MGQNLYKFHVNGEMPASFQLKTIKNLIKKPFVPLTAIYTTKQ